MEKNLDDRVKLIMAKIFKIDTKEINNDSTPHTIKSWDSLKHIHLVIALEKEFEVNFDQDEIAAMVSFPIIFATIEAYLD